MSAPATLHSRAPIERMRDIAARLRAGKMVNANALSLRWEMNPKTLWRDIEFMRDRLGYDLDWNPTKRTYVLLKAPEPLL